VVPEKQVRDLVNQACGAARSGDMASPSSSAAGFDVESGLTGQVVTFLQQVRGRRPSPHRVDSSNCPESRPRAGDRAGLRVAGER
jgi:hypothetical protein